MHPITFQPELFHNLCAKIFATNKMQVEVRNELSAVLAFIENKSIALIGDTSLLRHFFRD